MEICTEKPHVPLDVIELGSIGDQPHCPLTRGGSGRHRSSSSTMPTSMSLLDLKSEFKPRTPGGFTMGNFSTPTSKMTSEERFAMSQRSMPNTVTRRGMVFARPGRVSHMNWQGGPDNDHMGRLGGESDKVHAPNAFNNQASVADDDQSVDQSAEREVKGLLDQLTMEKFDTISNQIVEWANKSEAERDCQTLTHVTKLVFEKAIDETAQSEVYARLCRKMMERISANVQDDAVRGAGGRPIAGGQLFRKYLLDRCQEDLERRWATKGPAGEAEFYSTKHYVPQKTRRQGLGLIQFIGELYKLQMLSERIMHDCIQKLLSSIDNPKEEEIESLCRLLETVGKLLDKQDGRVHMDIYFTRMKELGRSRNITPRARFVLRVSSTVCVFQRGPYNFHLGSYRAA